MENTRMNGHWIGTFVAKGDETEVEFTEHITVKKIFLKPFVKAYLKKQQAQFISGFEKSVVVIKKISDFTVKLF